MLLDFFQGYWNMEDSQGSGAGCYIGSHIAHGIYPRYTPTFRFAFESIFCLLSFHTHKYQIYLYQHLFVEVCCFTSIWHRLSLASREIVLCVSSSSCSGGLSPCAGLKSRQLDMLLVIAWPLQALVSKYPYSIPLPIMDPTAVHIAGVIIRNN